MEKDRAVVPMKYLGVWVTCCGSLRELVEAKMKGIAIKPRPVSTPAPVIDLMAALKPSLAKEVPAARGSAAKRGSKAAPDQRQRALLLPVSGGRRKKAQPATVAERRRKKA
jgi:hypothetical protein